MYSKEDSYEDSEKHGAGLKPDKTFHKKCFEGTMSKKASLPGQMYVPTKTLPVDEFAGDEIMGKK